MLQISQEILNCYNLLLNNRNIPKSEQYDFRKWLRYYLDFCKKYNHSESKKENLPLFIKKLREKHQSSKQQKQSSNAITFYYSLLRTDSKKSYSDFNALNNSVNENIPDYNKDLLDKDKPLNNQIQSSLPVQSSNFRNQTNTANLQESDNHERAIGWNAAFNDLKNLIKIKHYSRKTLSAYTTWLKKNSGIYT